MTALALRAALALAALWLAAAPCAAIDNPDAPDRVADFQARARPYEARIGAAASTAETVAAYAEYERFLDSELNRVYQELAGRLDDDARAQLRRSQKRWLAFRDEEFQFIDDNWTQERFGTSAALSRGDYRCSLLKERTVRLLQYLRNYP